MRIEVENPMVVDRLWKNRQIEEIHYTELEQKIICETCKHSWAPDDIGEEALSSQIWEDKYTCNEKSCLESHHTGWAEKLMNNRKVGEA